MLSPSLRKLMLSTRASTHWPSTSGHLKAWAWSVFRRMLKASVRPSISTSCTSGTMSLIQAQSASLYRGWPCCTRKSSNTWASSNSGSMTKE